MFDQNLIIGLVVLAVVVMAVYSYAPKVRSMLSGFGREGFANGAPSASAKKSGATQLIPTNKVQAGGSAAPLVSSAPMMGATAAAAPGAAPAPPAKTGPEQFADYLSAGGADALGPVPMAAGQKPAGCYPREQLNPGELLPKDVNSMWAQMNPQGSGDIQGKNFLSAGALIGVNTVGQSLRNANYQLRSEPANPQVSAGPWMQSTIEPDLLRRSLD
jgi:hypothetical protein